MISYFWNLFAFLHLHKFSSKGFLRAVSLAYCMDKQISQFLNVWPALCCFNVDRFSASSFVPLSPLFFMALATESSSHIFKSAGLPTTNDDSITADVSYLGNLFNNAAGENIRPCEHQHFQPDSLYAVTIVSSDLCHLCGTQCWSSITVSTLSVEQATLCENMWWCCQAVFLCYYVVNGCMKNVKQISFSLPSPQATSPAGSMSEHISSQLICVCVCMCVCVHIYICMCTIKM